MRQGSRYDEARERVRNGPSRRRAHEPDEPRPPRQRYDDYARYRDREPPRRSRDRRREDQQRREQWREAQSRDEQSRGEQRRQRQWREDQWRQAFRDNDRQHDRARDVAGREREPDEQFHLNLQRDDRERQPPDTEWRRRERDDHGDVYSPR